MRGGYKIFQEMFIDCEILKKMANFIYFDENTQNIYIFVISEEEAKKLIKIRIV